MACGVGEPSPGDPEDLPATVGDLRRLLDEAMEKQRAEISKLLGEIATPIRHDGKRRSTPRSASRTTRGCEPNLPHCTVMQSDQDNISFVFSDDTFEPEFQGEPCRDRSSAHTMMESRFNMAKALGFTGSDGDFHPVSPGRQAARTSFISMQAKVKFHNGVPCLDRVLRSAWFENFCGAFILFNAIVIGLNAHRRALHPEMCEDFWDKIFLFFNVWFIFELLVRIFTFRREFICGRDWRWNLFDSVIVVSGVVEEIMERMYGDASCVDGVASSSRGPANSITAMRIIRVLRVVRIVKAFRTMSIFRELRVMVYSTLGCLVPLAWACLLLFFIQWCFGVYFSQLVTDYVTDALQAEGPDVLTDPNKPYLAARMYFGSLWLSIYTLFCSITGGINWQVAAGALLDATGMHHAVLLYMLFIALTMFAVLNVITGIFVENATKLALRDREIIIQDMLDRRDKYKEDALRVFREADTDGNGEITAEEFESHVTDLRVQAFLENLELDAMGAQRLFRLLDLDGNGKISAQEFVTGCMCLKGGAKTIDIAALMREVHRLSRTMSTSIAALDARMEHLAGGVAQARAVSRTSPRTSAE